MEIKLPALSVVDGQLRIPVSRKGGFSYDGSNVILDLEVNDPEAAATQDSPVNGNGKRKPKDEDQPKPSDAKPAAPTAPPPFTSRATTTSKGAS